MDLLSTVQDEAERLNRFIANLLDMTRLESGAAAPNMALNDLSDVLGARSSARARFSLITASNSASPPTCRW